MIGVTLAAFTPLGKEHQGPPPTGAAPPLFSPSSFCPRSFGARVLSVHTLVLRKQSTPGYTNRRCPPPFRVKHRRGVHSG